MYYSGHFNTICALAAAASGATEVDISFTAANMPWLKQGQTISLTGLKDEDDGTFSLDPAFVTEAKFEYRENSQTPTNLVHVRAVYYGKKPSRLPPPIPPINPRDPGSDIRFVLAVGDVRGLMRSNPAPVQIYALRGDAVATDYMGQAILSLTGGSEHLEIRGLLAYRQGVAQPQVFGGTTTPPFQNGVCFPAGGSPFWSLYASIDSDMLGETDDEEYLQMIATDTLDPYITGVSNVFTVLTHTGV
jgi:hypothetical protein